LILTSAVLQQRGIAHGFFGRQGGVSGGVYASLNCGPGSGDDRKAVMENRRRASLALSSDCSLVTLYQVHSAQVITVAEPWEIAANPRADGMATNRAGIALGILTADCVPVLLFDPEARVIGAAHAGWQGALAGITDCVLDAMARLGANPARIRAAAGPCIGPAAYEVGPEFEQKFVTADSANARFFSSYPNSGRAHFDLPAYVSHRLRQAAVEAVDLLGRCTYQEEDKFFSYRRTTHRKEADYGRQLSAIMLLP
jgi:purine-nucleoside/S-methyl-5'-thioadenosine phosphorylase / adenosine deaminase